VPAVVTASTDVSISTNLVVRRGEDSYEHVDQDEEDDDAECDEVQLPERTATKQNDAQYILYGIRTTYFHIV